MAAPSTDSGAAPADMHAPPPALRSATLPAVADSLAALGALRAAQLDVLARHLALHAHAPAVGGGGASGVLGGGFGGSNLGADNAATFFGDAGSGSGSGAVPTAAAAAADLAALQASIGELARSMRVATAAAAGAHDHAAKEGPLVSGADADAGPWIVRVSGDDGNSGP